MEEKQKCDYGCGQEAKYQFKNGKLCCSVHWKKCSVNRKRTGDLTRGRTKENDEGVKRQSEWMKNGGAVYISSFVSKEGHRNQAEKIKGRSKETHEGVRRQSEFMKNSGNVLAQSFVTEEDRKRAAEKISGSNNYRWIEDREQVFAPYTEEFYINAPKVRERDNYICQLCFKFGKSVHHINEDKKDSRIENMVNLCGRCHAKIHAKDNGIWIVFYQPYFQTIALLEEN